MAGWETEDESAGRLAASTLSPTLEASLSASAGPKLSRQRSITPPGDKLSKRSSRDMGKEEPISMLDPRRFTPTLHANLVSEILALRRDQEEKTRVIENLESTLHSTKQEHESLHQDFTLVSKESRSLKRQMSLLEGGTSSALGELARERDEAVESVTETKKRLDVAQKKIRNQEDDSQRVHDIWSKEKDNWDDEKRKYERRLHVAESRLKSILEEVAAYQAAHQHSASGHHDNDIEEAARDNDAASVRTMSMTNSLRYSLVQSPGPAQQAGHSLADELGFDADDDDHSDYDGAESVLSSPQVARAASREGGRHQRNYSTESGLGNAVRSRLFMNTSVMDALEGVSEETQAPAPKITYTETGVQYSPPPSPLLAPREKPAATRTESVELETGPLGIEANQSRKRSQLNLKTAVVKPPTQSMVSTSAQTIETPISPPRTPKLADEFDEADAPTEKPYTMVSSSSQTESSPKAPKLTFTAPPLPPLPPIPIDIPSISIQPPTSRPTTPLSPRLPQHFKNFGCQVNLPAIATFTSDAAVQTEGIQVDKRLARLPAHLQPSAITSRPSSPVKEASTAAGRDFTPAPANAATRQPLRGSLTQAFGEPPSSPIESTAEDGLDVYLGGHNDDGPLSVLQKSPLRRPRRYSSLFAGFDSASSDGADEFGDAEVSDAEYRTALSAPRPQSTASRPSKRSSFGTATTSPDQATYRSGHSSAKSYRADLYNSFGITDNSIVNKHSRKSSRAQEKSAASSVTSGSKPGSAMRKAAIIQNGIVNQQTRSRSPSLPDGRNPPFPIPTRDSSKRLLFNAYNPSEAQSSPPRESDRRQSGSRSQYSSSNVRRVRSAAALARNQRSRQHSGGSPPPMSVSTEATEVTESPGMPPLPRNDLTTPRNRDRSGSHYRRHRQELSTTTANTAHTGNTLNTDPMSTSQASTSQSSGVVDAIAQTMVGEWMFKYVRRRKSFSVPDAGKDDSGNDRHKRWVWLAPYERSILWSSRQPSSGSALMGKSGRKLTIQSVLDVKDDNPAPKTAGPVFNRSILILTPQRALKFTAVNAERHYLWLTALSFLAHSSQAVPENITAPQAQLKPPPAQQQPLPEFEPPVAKVRRPGIRDSIRLAKGKGSSNPRSGPPSVPSIPSVPSTRMGEVASFRVPPSGVGSSQHTREKSGDAAEPPMVPRFDNNRKVPTSAHGRKRSNTGSHIPPPLSFRGFSGPVGSPALTDGTYSTADNSVDTVGSDMYYSQASSNTTWGMSQGGSQRTSEASTRPSNFFDAIGTVRMEAFISPLAFSQVNDYTEEHDRYRKIVRRRSKEIRRRNSRSRQRDSYSSRGCRSHDDYYGGSRTAGEEEIFRDDPFKGF